MKAITHSAPKPRSFAASLGRRAVKVTNARINLSALILGSSALEIKQKSEQTESAQNSSAGPPNAGATRGALYGRRCEMWKRKARRPQAGRDCPPPDYYHPPAQRPEAEGLTGEISWREAEGYFRSNPGDLVRRMFQWAKKDDRRAARGILSRWLRSEHPELRCAGQVALDAWIECFCSEAAYRQAYGDWQQWFAERRREIDYG